VLDYLMQNFNWPTFLIALGFFVLVANLLNLIKAVILKKRSEKMVRIAEQKHAELRDQLKAKTKELDQLLKGGK
jgi:uncharacterized integral membrane protein